MGGKYKRRATAKFDSLKSRRLGRIGVVPQTSPSKNELSWVEAIEKTIEDNGGAASLEKMYVGIAKYRDLSTNANWQATLRGVLYRDMRQRGQIVRLGLGVFGFKNASAKNSVFQNIADKVAIVPASRHATIQGMLLEMGNFYGYETYTADPSSDFDGKKLGSIASLAQVPQFTYPDLQKQSTKIDVLWFRKNTKRPFPKAAFEVENTPEFRRSLLKLYQLRDFKTDFYLVADESKKSLFNSRLDNDPFNQHKGDFLFRSFNQVTDLYVAAAQHFILKEQFFPVKA